METTLQLSRKKKALYFLIMFAFLAIIFEVSARIYLRVTQGYSGGPLLQYQFDPYKNVLPTPNFVDTRGVQHNSQGFRRSSEVARAKPEGTFRIFLMGGSTAYGTGGLWPHIQRTYPILKNSQTIDTYLEHDLSQRFPGTKFEVINAAIPSIWTHHHLIYLNQSILKYKPDMVILLDGFNDFYYYTRGHDQFASYAYQEHSRIIMGDPTLRSLLYVNTWWLGRKSAFVHVALRRMRAVKLLLSSVFGSHERVPIDVSGAMAGLREVYPENALKIVERIALLLQHEKVDGVFVLQPMLVMERGRPGMPAIEKKLFEFNVKSYLPNYEAFMHQAVPFVRDQERATVERYGATFLDGTTIFRAAQGQIFTDYAHLTPEANRLFAANIAASISCRVSARLDSTSAASIGERDHPSGNHRSRQLPGCTAPSN
jgi:hypothetical protein